MADDPSTQTANLSRLYGTNWTKTNVGTLFEWVNIAAFNIQCLEHCIKKYRQIIRNQMILNLILSTSSGTISVSQFGENSSATIDIGLRILFTLFSFLIAISAGALKIYQIQERLETAIRIKQEWTVFSTTIASELQLPIQLRRDGLWMIKRNKDTYLDLMKTELEIPDSIKKKVAREFPHQENLHLDVVSLPRIMIDICNSELTDMQSANTRNRDRFTHTSNLPGYGSNINSNVPSTVMLNVSSSTSPLQESRMQ
jgi:hypothetical protein